MDPLSLLRDFNSRRQLEQVQVQNDRVNFGDAYVFPKTSYTAFKGVQKDYYTLEVVLYLLQHRHLSHPEYIKQASAAKIGIVNTLDKKVLLDFLDGKADVQLDAAADRLLPGMAAPGGADDAEEGPAAKRARMEGMRDLCHNLGFAATCLSL